MDLTQNSIFKTLLKFSIPFVLSFLLQSLYSIIDLVVIGHFGGTYSLAGVNMGTQIMDLVLAVGEGLTLGTTVLVSHHVGAGKKDAVGKIFNTSLIILFTIAVTITILMEIFAVPVMTVMQTPAESYSESINYYRICALGSVFMFGFNLIFATLNGLGDSKTPLKFVIVAALTNIVLDVLFVAGFKMGAAGAATATVIAQMICCLSCFIYFKRKEKSLGLQLNRKALHIDKNILKDFLKIGLPGAFQNSILTISLVVVIAAANVMGVYAAAAVGVCAKINVIFILPCIAVNAAENVMVGQNTGAGKRDRVVKTVKYAFVMMLPYAFFVLGLFYFGGGFLLQLFTNDAQTIALGSAYFKYHCWDYCLVMPAAYALGGLFSGTGHTMVVAVGNFLSSVLFRIPLVILLSQTMGMGTNGIGLAFPVSTLSIDIFYFIILMTGLWKKPVTHLNQ